MLKSVDARFACQRPVVEGTVLLLDCLKNDLAHGGLTKGQRQRAVALLKQWLADFTLSQSLFAQLEKKEVLDILERSWEKASPFPENTVVADCAVVADSAAVNSELKPDNLQSDALQPYAELPQPTGQGDFFPKATGANDRVAEGSLYLGKWLGRCGYLCLESAEGSWSALLGSAEVFQDVPLLLTDVWKIFPLDGSCEKARILCFSSAANARAELEKKGTHFLMRFLQMPEIS